MQVETQFNYLLAAYDGRGRDALLPLLWDVQTAEGWISPEAVQAISYTLRVPESDIYGVIGFYTLFHDEPTGQRIIRVCTDSSCALAGADALLHEIEQQCAEHPEKYTIEHSPCLGMCDHAPAAFLSIQGEGEIAVPSATVEQALTASIQPAYQANTQSQQALLFQSLSDDATLEYDALRIALLEKTPEEIIEEVVASGLIGRGGAAFPTGLKWRFTRQAAGDPKYIICNADESEPGTFKDRVLMEAHPHLILQGMALAGYAVGASQGIIFVRGEYPVAESRLRQAIQQAEALGLLGENILQRGFSFHVEIRRGAGAYICGEETALFEAIEGKRGFPRIKPPYPTTHGLFGKPTVVNNVETLSNIPAIVKQGGAWFKQLGTEKSTGTKLVSVSGHVHQPGVFEIIPGLPLRDLLADYCGGVVGNLQAVLMGGAAGTFLTPDDLDVPLTFEDLQAIGSTFGSGAIVVFNDTVDLRDMLLRLAKFFQHESCGKCFPCQLGTQRQVELIERLPAPMEKDQERLRDVGLTMTEASLCGLGQTAASAILSAMDKFPQLFAGGEHV